MAVHAKMPHAVDSNGDIHINELTALWYLPSMALTFSTLIVGVTYAGLGAILMIEDLFAMRRVSAFFDSFSTPFSMSCELLHSPCNTLSPRVFVGK